MGKIEIVTSINHVLACKIINNYETKIIAIYIWTLLMHSHVIFLIKLIVEVLEEKVKRHICK